MAAFSYHHHIHQPFLLDSSIFLPNATPQDHFSQYSSDPLLHEIQAEDDHSRAVESSSTVDDNDPNSLPRKQTTPDSSTVVDTNNNKLETGEQVTQKLTPLDKKKRKHTTATSSFNSAQSKDAREHKGKKHKKLMEGGGKKDEEIKKVKSTKKEEVNVGEEPPTGYIHVRARRGQATDSHSLAERVRREKISERMKMLQRLVPGCDKVTGRAVMLDEIINYVQSLQNQVEFLSMKLASVNPLFYEFGMEVGALMVKPEVNADTSTNIITTTAAAAAATTFSSAPNYPYLESAAPLLLQQGQSPNPFSQHDSESLLWDVEDQRQNFLNPSGFSNNLCSFN